MAFEPHWVFRFRRRWKVQSFGCPEGYETSIAPFMRHKMVLGDISFILTSHASPRGTAKGWWGQTSTFLFVSVFWDGPNFFASFLVTGWLLKRQRPFCLLTETSVVFIVAVVERSFLSLESSLSGEWEKRRDRLSRHPYDVGKRTHSYTVDCISQATLLSPPSSMFGLYGCPYDGDWYDRGSTMKVLCCHQHPIPYKGTGSEIHFLMPMSCFSSKQNP